MSSSKFSECNGEYTVSNKREGMGIHRRQQQGAVHLNEWVDRSDQKGKCASLRTQLANAFFIA